MASRVASLLAGCGWMTPLRVPFSLSLALALLRRPLLPRRRRGSNGTKCVRRSGVISKRRAMHSLRSYHGIAVYKPADDGIEPWLNLNNAARLLQVAPKTLRVATEAGEIEALHPLPDGPWIFSRTVLSTASARNITERARQNPRHP